MWQNVLAQIKKLKWKFTLDSTLNLRSLSGPSENAHDLHNQKATQDRIKAWKKLQPIESDVALRDNMQKILNRVNEKTGRMVFRLKH